jgi:hypothetical protein
MQKTDTIPQSEVIGYDEIKYRKGRSYRWRKGWLRSRGHLTTVRTPITKNWKKVNMTPVVTKWEFYCAGLSWNY